MKALEFKLKGETAFLKIPEVNTYRYLTYSSIHKVAIQGILGAIVGLKGYGNFQQGKYPEFYEKLQNIKVSIKIENPMDIKKKFQSFNNTVGYASNEQGNNLIITEQWLEKPSWRIRLLVESIPEELPIVDYLLNKKAVYIPYLGKNDHFATIEEVNMIEMEEIEEVPDNIIIDGLFTTDVFKVYSPGSFKKIYKYSEYLPIALESEFNHYEKEDLSQTDGKLKLKESKQISKGTLFKKDNHYYYFI
ncbi:MAG: type I-B CRISPR-associated protein Cas5b [Gallicola sp.]|nr:type I-B CRISPR-associated protein Cas5b [Gallicola sp.]